ncbi:hypothetical protein [Streptomyces sp. NPDC026673]|uniref:hypothetical protein n=1 Tax=Streptomycetaceae TaxID=2062 RepID=UPI0033C7CC66
MDLIEDIIAIRYPLPKPGDVHPEELFADALEAAERDRAEAAADLQARCDGLEIDPLLLELQNASARRRAAEADTRRLLAYARQFHGTRPYKLEDLAAATGMTPSGVRTAFSDAEIAFVTEHVNRAADGRPSRSGPRGAR